MKHSVNLWKGKTLDLNIKHELVDFLVNDCGTIFWTIFSQRNPMEVREIKLLESRAENLGQTHYT